MAWFQMSGPKDTEKARLGLKRLRWTELEKKVLFQIKKLGKEQGSIGIPFNTDGRV